MIGVQKYNANQDKVFDKSAQINKVTWPRKENKNKKSFSRTSYTEKYLL